MKHLENIRRKEDDDYEAGPMTHSREQQAKKKQKTISLPVLDNKEDNHDENRDQNTPENELRTKQ